jgi:hypothetical protein
MAMTNAISGMTIVGGMLQLGGGLLPGTIPQGLAAAAGAYDHCSSSMFVHIAIILISKGQASVLIVIRACFRAHHFIVINNPVELTCHFALNTVPSSYSSILQ